jgi:DNA-binding CsgD family transcriptional regulator
MNAWKNIMRQLGMIRKGEPRYYELEESLELKLQDLALKEQRPAEEIQAEMIEEGITRRHTRDKMFKQWESLSPREQQATAFTCLGYTNRQMALRIGISPETVKVHVRNALAKFELVSKSQLQQTLRDWDFSEWENKK